MVSLDYCCNSCLVHFLKNLRWHLHNCLPRPHLIVNFERFGDQVPPMIKTVMDTGLSKKTLLPPAQKVPYIIGSLDMGVLFKVVSLHIMHETIDHNYIHHG